MRHAGHGLIYMALETLRSTNPEEYELPSAMLFEKFLPALCEDALLNDVELVSGWAFCAHGLGHAFTWCVIACACPSLMG